ncbi:hypothetical protein AABB24_009679, partial [Solanum stoloniferum]
KKPYHSSIFSSSHLSLRAASPPLFSRCSSGEIIHLRRELPLSRRLFPLAPLFFSSFFRRGKQLGASSKSSKAAAPPFPLSFSAKPVAPTNQQLQPTPAARRTSNQANSGQQLSEMAAAPPLSLFPASNKTSNSCSRREFWSAAIAPLDKACLEEKL